MCLRLGRFRDLVDSTSPALLAHISARVELREEAFRHGVRPQ
jgi:hypothetical protein